MDDTFKKRLKGSDALIGSIITIPSPEVGEIFARAGFDWLFVDLEHSTLSVREAQTILQAASPTPCIVRVPANDEVWIKKALDIGSAGLVIPLIKSVGDAEKAVRLCKYPPEGSRGVGLARAHGYGAAFQEYVSGANEDLTVIIQIEHIDAVDHIDEIAKVKGIDGWFVGPYDLSASMGMPGATTAPEVLSAIGKVKKAAEQAKLAIGIYCSTGEAAKAYIRDGYAFVTIGIDTLLMNGAARDLVGRVKE
jgi:2-keto-3-deoxy-L-rhamnonate aldolase RhmA